jgi:hypothetical protein
MLYTACSGIKVLCGVVLARLSGIVSVAALVMLACCLARHAEAMGYFWPTDAQRHCVVNERC